MEAVTGRIVLDEYVAKVAGFMEREVPADKLVRVAKSLPALASVIWEQSACGSLERDPIHATPQGANESGLASACVGDGSAAVADGL